MTADTGIAARCVDLEKFKQTLLSYDFFKDVTDDRNDEKEFPDVPLHFQDAEHYLEILTPLFWEEVKANLVRAKVVEMKKGNVEEVQLKQYRQDKHWIRLEMLRNKAKATQFLYGMYDLVLMTQSEDPFVEDAVHILAWVDQSIANTLSMSIVLSSDPRSVAVAKLLRDDASWQIVKVISTQTMVREWEGLQLMPRIPLRHIVVNKDEGVAVADTGQEMQAAPPQGGTQDEASLEDRQFCIPDALQRRMVESHNESQLKAIQASRKIEGVTLVQGPPGTGKTKTVLGILAVLLNARAQEKEAVSYTRTGKRKRESETNADDETSSDEDDEALKARQRQRLQRLRGSCPWLRADFRPWTNAVQKEVLGPGDRELAAPYAKIKKSSVVSMSEIAHDIVPKKVLIVAPSNAAVDEVLRRAAAEGIMNEEGVNRARAMVRLGPNVHSSLERFSLQATIRRRLQARSVNPDANVQEEEKEAVMKEASLLFATLSTSGSRDVVGFQGDFDTVVMDEASQGLEVSTLTPLKMGCRRLIMVGDPQQLPATCFSQVCQKFGYERSLFQRLQESNCKVNMLQVQYRMHPHISQFPSERFYDGKLIDALGLEAFEKFRPTPWSSLPCFAPVVFFNLEGTTRREVQSLVNDEEADFVIHLFVTLSRLYPSDKWRERLAIISPYREQVQLIRTKIKILFGLDGKKSVCPVDVNTVDGFQGREKDAIIVSVVRSNPSEGIGFVKDKRRMNVAFTRARSNLWVVGNAKVLFKNEDWAEFIKQQRARCTVMRCSKPYTTFLPRYLHNWYNTHPNVKPPSEEFLGERPSEPEEEDLAEGVNFEVSEQELADLEREEREQARYLRPDIEEVSSEGEGDGGTVSDLDDGAEGPERRGADANVTEEVGKKPQADDVDDEPEPGDV